jgi:hypothetical protein
VSDVTQILERVGRGMGRRRKNYFHWFTRELRKLAAHKMAQEQPGHTAEELQPKFRGRIMNDKFEGLFQKLGNSLSRIHCFRATTCVGLFI